MVRGGFSDMKRMVLLIHQQEAQLYIEYSAYKKDAFKP